LHDGATFASNKETKVNRRIAGAAAAAAVALVLAAPSEARVTRIVIDQSESPTYSGQSFGTVGQYEKLRGRIFGEIDPNDRRNAIIQDIQLAPRNAAGRVEYISSFTLLKPIDISRGNHGLLQDMVNRGNRNIFGFTVGGEPGDGYWHKQGYAMLFSGWQGDLTPIPTATAPFTATNETINVPIARNPDGSPVTGPFFIRIQGPSGNTVALANAFGGPTRYPPATLDTTQASLLQVPPETISGQQTGAAVPIASGDWAFADCRTVPFPGTSDPTRICVRNPFDPTKAYYLTYVARDPFVLGIGLAATRDIDSFFRYEQIDALGNPNPLGGNVGYVIAHGTSQSGNTVKTMIHLGFTEDESGRKVWDGAVPFIAARQNPINFRFAIPGGAASLFEPGSEPVVWWEDWPDTVRGRPTAGMLDRCRLSNTCPRIFETNGAAEFFGLRLSPGYFSTAANADIPLPENVRRYYFPSTTHGGGGGGFSTTLGNPGACVLPPNPNPERETMRALYVALRDWVVNGVTPPPSRYPQIARGTATAPNRAAMGFPVIPGTPDPANLLLPVLDYDFGPSFNYNDLTGVFTQLPPRIKQVVPSLVPRTDADGNEVDGIKSALLMAPLGSYLGWNQQASGVTAGQNCAFSGGFIPFALTAAERAASGDPRPSIEERYPSHAAYVAIIRAATTKLAKERFLLPEDAARLVTEADAGNVRP
jgi:hypothetical protein